MTPIESAMLRANCPNELPDFRLVSILAKHLAAKPRNSTLWTALGAVYMRLGQKRSAEKALAHACSLDGCNILARVLTGDLLLASGNLTVGPRLYQERWKLVDCAESMRYPPELLWDGQCKPDTRLLLWTGEEADPGFVLARLAPLLAAQRMRIALDLPEHLLALASSWWPELHKARIGEEFHAHYPLADVLTLWVNPNVGELRKVTLP